MSDQCSLVDKAVIIAEPLTKIKVGSIVDKLKDLLEENLLDFTSKKSSKFAKANNRSTQ